MYDIVFMAGEFLSTLSLRRATEKVPADVYYQAFLSTLSLRRATQILDDTSGATYHFYPRSPCGERPVLALCFCGGACDFYPRSPCGERPPPYNLMIQHTKISIHALLAESDSPASVTPAASRNFYPRSPCGERQRMLLTRFSPAIFLSTLSLRRATPRVAFTF